jgi:hypothetical protein
MARASTKLATVVGTVLALGGVGLFTAAFVANWRTFGLPAGLWVASLVGGLPLAFAGAVVGVRYGNMERYHSYYDEETGRIDGHPMGRVLNPFVRDNSPGDDPVGKYVPSRAFIAAMCAALAVAPIAYLWWAGLSAGLLASFGVMLLLGAIAAFLLSDLVARQMYDSYG